ncbi:MAG: SPFH domain-containing protein [Polyangiaceae bacterium]
MGIIDFVKGGVQKMMILRPDAQKDKVVYKHPDQTFPFWSQLTVDSDEVCLFFKDGQYRGVLGPGRHSLDTQNIPFLGMLVDKFTGGNVFVSELFFVTTSPMYGQGFGGPIGSMRDPELDIRVNPRVFGTYSFRIVDPVRFVIEFWRQKAGDPEAALGWVRDQLVMGVKATLTRLLRSGELTMMDLGAAGPDVARAIVQSCPDLANIGVQVLEIAKLNINLSDEDQLGSMSFKTRSSRPNWMRERPRSASIVQLPKLKRGSTRWIRISPIALVT